LLPFDDAEGSPLRLDGRVHLVVPERFTSEALGECASTRHHGAKATVERLSATSLQVHATKLTRFIGGPSWSEHPEWQPFLADLISLTEGMEKLAAAMMKNNKQVQAVQDKTTNSSSPEDEEDVKGSDYKLRCSSGECHDKYKALRVYACLRSLLTHTPYTPYGNVAHTHTSVV
jgi:hypothetical protein